MQKYYNLNILKITILNLINKKVNIFVFLFLLIANVSSAQSRSSSLPNIIFILADDMGYGDLGCYGQKLIRTPNIDKLAKEGMRFTQHYAGSTVCAPSRGVLMTGLNTAHSYIRGNFSYHKEGNLPIPDSTLTVAEILKKEGYITAMIGKWGLGGPRSTGGPNNQGFDYSFGYLDQRNAHEYYPEYLWENEEKFPLTKNLNHQKLQYSHDLFTDKALKFVKEHKNGPFFLYLPYTIPHGKYQVPEDVPYSNKDWSQPVKNYAAMITRMDGDVGKLMHLLKSSDLDENTIVIFSSDNGPTRAVNKVFDSNGKLKGFKGDLYEGGIRIPLIARWSGKIAPGTVSHHISDFSDFLPTACEIARIKPPKNIDGISYLSELLGKKQKQHSFLYWEFYKYNYSWKSGQDPKLRNPFESQAIRMGKWKAVRSDVPKNPTVELELYDLSTDQGETNNVAEQHTDVVDELETLMQKTRYDVEYFGKDR